MALNLDFLKRLEAVECRDSTYQPQSDPLVFARAEGSVIWDVEGKSYVDLCAGFGALPLGHGSVALKEVASSFAHKTPLIEHGMGDVYPSEEKILFLEALKSYLSPHYDLGALALGGGQAVEIALKTAMLYTGKSGFIVFQDSYHGLDLGVLPLTAREDFKVPFNAWISSSQVMRLPYGCSKEDLETAILKLKARGNFAGAIVEPAQGRAGVIFPESSWLKTLGEVVHDHKGLLILDEIFTGFGRIGLISSAASCDADLSCFGKAIGGGFPVSACFGKKNIMDAWPKSRGEAIHTGTFFGHPFTAAVGRRTLEVIARGHLSERSLKLGAKALSYLHDRLKNCPLVREVRGGGLFMGIEFVDNGQGAFFMDSLRAKGIIVLPSGTKGQVLSITPALNIEESLFFRALDVVIESIESR